MDPPQSAVPPPRTGGAPFVAQSIDEARSFYSTRFGSIVAEPYARRERFRWTARPTTLGPLTVLRSEVEGGLRASSDPVEGFYSLTRPIFGGSEITHNRKTVNAVPGEISTLTSPMLPARVVLQSGQIGMQIVIPLAVVEASFAALFGEPPRGGLRFDPRVNLTSAPLIAGLTDAIIAHAGRAATGEVGKAAEVAAARLAAKLVHALLVLQPHDRAPLLARPPPEPGLQRVVLAEELMAASCTEEITAEGLAEATGVSVRSLQRAFRTHRRTTPLAFLRERRFEEARARLLAEPSLSVTEVALACGLVHLGRFSQGYRARFGETPSETRRRK